ncbi:MAG: protein jag [Oscillospiraceae bacterium]|nr:protein jag [Oscillospiraceae bacterium]
MEKSGRTVNDAITAALEELELSIDDVHVDVLNEGKTGLFGLLSSKPAKVRVSELDEDERMPQPGYIGASNSGTSSGRSTDSARATSRPTSPVVEDASVNDTQFGSGDYSEADADADAEAEADADVNGGATINMGVGDGASSEDEESGDSRYTSIGSGGQRDTSYASSAGGDPAGGDVDDDASIGGGMDVGGLDADSYPDDEQGYSFEQEIDRALEYLSEIFNGIHVSVDMDAEPSEDGFSINIESEDSGILIGHRGETLDAIQYLLNLYMNKGRNGFMRVSVDVENYKKKREAALIRLAGQMADKVVRLRRNFTMDAMNSYERRIIHSTLQNHPRVETYSVGEEPNRKVVVTMKNRGGYSSR